MRSRLVAPVCTDDGVGLTETERTGTRGFGLKILEASAVQVGGSFELRSPQTGTELTLEFPLLA